MEIKILHRQGVPIRDIARQMGMPRNSVRKLEDEYWLCSEVTGGTGPGSGRRTVRYRINPAVTLTCKGQT
jgi:hypothetical protein